MGDDPQNDELRAIVSQHVATLAAELGTKILSLERAFEKQTDDYNRVPTLLQTAIINLRELLEVKVSASVVKARLELDGHCAESSRRFQGIDEKFGERDTRVDQRAIDTKLAVDAALVSLKETMGKLEDGFTKQIDSMRLSADDKSREYDRRMSEMKDNHTALSNQLSGVKRGGSDIGALAVGSAGVVLAIVSIIALIIKWTIR